MLRSVLVENQNKLAYFCYFKLSKKQIDYEVQFFSVFLRLDLRASAERSAD